MQVPNQTSVITDPQMTVDERLDSGLKSLRLDRSGKRPGQSTQGKWRWLLSGLVLLIAASAGWFFYGRLNAAIEVETFRLRAATTASEGFAGTTILNATGYIIAAHKIELASKVSGRVAWIGVEKGDRVVQGQMLVRLEDEEFRARLTEAQGQLQALTARLAALINGSRPEETARAQAELEQVRADLQNAGVSLERTRSLVAQGILAQQTLDDARARYDAQAARFNAFEKSYVLSRTGPRREEIDAMQAQVKQAEGSLAYAASQLENTIIRAPISGVILERNVERGEFVTTGFVGDRGAKGYVVSLADLEDLQAELDINQNDFAKLDARPPALVTTDAYPDRKYRGEIDEISPEANRQKATVQVKVKVLNPDEYLRPEMNASVAFQAIGKSEQSGAIKAPLTLPASALRDGAVFIVVDGKAERRAVQVSGSSSQGAMITSGLIGGEDVILNPPATLQNGQRVRPKEENQ
jgi:HlyD family secretion protein